MKRLISISLLTVILLITAGFDSCGKSAAIFAGIRIGLAAAKTANVSPVIIKDLDDGIASVERGEQCFNAVVGDKAQKRIGQAKCGFQIAQDLRAILARHNVGGSETANKIAGYINTTILALEEFYRTVTGPTAMVDDSGAAEKRLELKLKEVEKGLKSLK